MNWIKYKDKEMLMISQVSELFNEDTKTLARNFQRNKDKYIEGVHYYVLKGVELKEFKKDCIYDLKFTSILYLWTKDGINLLAKSNRSEVAWELIGGD